MRSAVPRHLPSRWTTMLSWLCHWRWETWLCLPHWISQFANSKLFQTPFLLAHSPSLSSGWGLQKIPTLLLFLTTSDLSHLSLISTSLGHKNVMHQSIHFLNHLHVSPWFHSTLDAISSPASPLWWPGLQNSLTCTTLPTHFVLLFSLNCFWNQTTHWW